MKQGVYQVSDVKQYALGKYIRVGKKGFIYAKAGGTVVPDIGAKQGHNQKMGMYSTAAPLAAGDTLVTITITAPLDIDLNELAGGQLVVFPGGDQTFMRTIVSHNAIVTSGTLSVVVDAPVPCAVAAGKGCEAIINPYDGVVNESNEWTPVMGMPTKTATVGQFVWLQVEGPSWCAPEAEVGAAANYLEVCFGGNGALMRRDDAAPGQQRAGMVIAPNTTGDGQGAPFIMLNIDH